MRRDREERRESMQERGRGMEKNTRAD